MAETVKELLPSFLYRIKILSWRAFRLAAQNSEYHQGRVFLNASPTEGAVNGSC